MAQTVKGGVVGTFFLAVGAWRDDRGQTATCAVINDVVGIVTAVGKDATADFLEQIKQGDGFRAVVHVAGRQRHAQGPSGGVGGEVKFRVAPPFVRAMPSEPPRAPEAWGWALT